METHLSKLLAIQRQVNALVAELTKDTTTDAKKDTTTDAKKGRGRPRMTTEEREKAKAIRDAEKAAEAIKKVSETASETKPKKRIIKVARVQS